MKVKVNCDKCTDETKERCICTGCDNIECQRWYCNTCNKIVCDVCRYFYERE